jgi:hydrogenase nickel incorporation protein HypB
VLNPLPLSFQVENLRFREWSLKRSRSVRTVDVKQGILSKNDRLARKLRQRFEEAGVYVLNMVSSPGTGKTELLQRTLKELSEAG